MMRLVAYYFFSIGCTTIIDFFGAALEIHVQSTQIGIIQLDVPFPCDPAVAHSRRHKKLSYLHL